MAEKEVVGAAATKSAPAANKGRQLGDLVVEYLERLGVEYVFGVPGGSIEPLYNAMARSARRGGLRPIVARHEAGAAFMAAGYTMETGKLGVCCSTTGPGATNLITGVASAYMEKIPMLVITAQTALPYFGKWALQESSCTAVDTVAMFKACTRYSSLVSHRGQLEEKLITAVLAAHGPAPGPAHLSIPLDILASTRRRHAEKPLIRFEDLLHPNESINPQVIESLCKEISRSANILLVIGEDCGEGISQILEFAEMIKAPIVCGPVGKRWIDHRHPQFKGVLGFAGHASATNAIRTERVDLILAVGTRMSDLTFGVLDADLQKKVVQIEPSSEHFHRAPLAGLHVYGTLSTIFLTLKERLGGERKRVHLRLASKPGISVPIPGCEDRGSNYFAPAALDEPLKTTSEASPIKPQRLMRELSLRLPESTRFVIDSGNSWAWSTHYLFMRSNGLFRMNMGYGPMGWAIGASVGTAIGSPQGPVVCITGDGSWLMSGQEITTAVAEKLSVIFVVLNDRSLGMVKHGQRLGGGEPISFELPPVDFAQMARAVGAQGHTVRTVLDLNSLSLDEIGHRREPMLLDVHIDPEEVPAIGLRMKALGQIKRK